MMCDVNTYPFLGFCIEQKINISTIVTIVLFLLGYAIAKMVDHYNRKAVRKKYLVALLQEIELNIERLNKDVTDLDKLTPGELADFLKIVHNRPLVFVTYDSIIFQSNTEVLQDLQHILIRVIIKFYGRLDTIKTHVESIEYKAFETISLDSRATVFARLKDLIGNGITLGESARTGIALHLRL